MSSLPFGVKTTGPVTYIAACLALALAAMAAAGLPGRCAALI